MKTYSNPTVYRGLNFRTLVAARNVKTAASILGVTNYIVTTYCNKIEGCIVPKPLARYAQLERSGETPYIFSEEEIKEIHPLDFVEKRINEYRQRFPIYFANLKHHNLHH